MAQDSGRKVPRLRFSKEEMSNPVLEKPIRKVRRAAKKVDKAESKIPMQKVLAIERATDAQTGKSAARLRFGEIPRKKPAAKLTDDALRRAPAKLLRDPSGKKKEDDGSVGNVGKEAVNSARGLGETAFQVGQDRVRYAEKLRPYRNLASAERRLDSANVKYLQKRAAQSNPPDGSSLLSRWQQRRAIKRQYAAIKHAQGASTGAGATARAGGKLTERIARSFYKNKKGLAVGLLLFMLFTMVMNGLSACAPIVQSSFQATIMSTYPADDDEMLAAERMYANMEKDLKNMLDSYERDHDYDEYHFERDEIWHDPHVLMAILSAWYGGEAWTADQAAGYLPTLFSRQYKLTETVERETRYRQEERTGTYYYTDPETGERELREYTYHVDVPYYYYICSVTLINENLSHLPIYIMSEERVGMYAMYRATLGNKPDLFRGNRYAAPLEDPVLYDIPPEALEDPVFAALIAEAEKYLGYPYIWGGSSPSTSFDCSGFISWVFTQSGVLNVGRLGATSLYGVCSPITPEEARPGDLVFFQGTLPHNEGITHVGLYVGNGMMIHCGSPITYADLRDRFFQEHLWGYGRPRIH